jgi:hypothetical protein
MSRLIAHAETRRFSPRAVGFFAIIVFCTTSAAAQTAPNLRVEARLMSWADVADQSTDSRHQLGTDFLVRRARLVVQGQITDSLSVQFQVGQDNIGGKFLTPDGSVTVKDFYINYRGSNALQFAAGQFKVPFLRANLESGFNQILVDRATVVTLRPAREGSRDVGVMAWGNVRGFQYRIAAFDGSDQDGTARKADDVRVTARIAQNCFTTEPGMGYTGSYLGVTRVVQVAAQVDVQNARTDPRDDSGFRSVSRDYRAYAIEAMVEQPLGRWAITADGALIHRHDDYIDAGIPSRRLRGYYAQGGVLLPSVGGPGRLQLAWRREQWKTERASMAPTTSRTTTGATYYVQGHSRKLQADYTVKREYPEVDNNEFRLSAVVTF